jgi:hypothetical protein
LPENQLWKPIDRRPGAAKSDLPRIAGFEARVSDALVRWSSVPGSPHHPGLGPRMAQDATSRGRRMAPSMGGGDRDPARPVVPGPVSAAQIFFAKEI